MNARAEAGITGSDTVRLVVAVALLVAGITGFYYFAEYSTLLRVISLLVVAGVATAVAMTTDPGRRLWQFGVDSRSEVRKVVWPTRQETTQTTLVVLVMVIILAIVLWLFDMALTGILRLLTGHGG
jgi:preprotein translocase subunit SecE